MGAYLSTNRAVLVPLIAAGGIISLAASFALAWLIAGECRAVGAGGGPEPAILTGPVVARALAAGVISSAALGLAATGILRRAASRPSGEAPGESPARAGLDRSVLEVAAAADLPALGRAVTEVLHRAIPACHAAVVWLEGASARVLAARDLESGAELSVEMAPGDPLLRFIGERPAAILTAGELPFGRTALPGDLFLAAAAPAPASPSESGGLLGCFLSRTNGGPRFAEADLERARFIAEAALVHLRRLLDSERRVEAKALEVELATAELVQKTLFPRSDLRLEGLIACGHFASASRTCGDWYGYIHDGRRRQVTVMIGDVTGHGVPSALIASAANSFVRTIDQVKATFYDLEVMVRQVRREIESVSSLDLEPMDFDPLDPARLLQFLNANILGTGERSMEMTFFASTFHLPTRELYYASAGHEPPFVYRAAGTGRAPGALRGEHIECLPGEGPRIGDRTDARFQLCRTRLEPGDAVLYYTDGLVELRNRRGEEFGDRRVIRVLERSAPAGAEAVRAELRRAIEGFREGEPLADDLSFVVTTCG